MQDILYVQSNFVSIIVLCFLYFSKSYAGVKAVDQKYYDRIIIATIAVLFADSAMWLVNGKDFPGALFLNYFVSTLCYYLTTADGLLCLLYVDFKVHNDTLQKMRDRMMPFYIVQLFCGLILIVNLIPGAEIIFKISSDNVYSRSMFFWIYTLIPFAYMAHSSIIAFKASRKEKSILLRREYFYLSIFIIPPFIGGILQTISGLSFTWSFVTIAILILFVKIQNQQVSTDILTGVNNRRQLENYLHWCLEQPDAQQLYLLMIDIDNFKAINDRFGHTVGDNALVDAAKILAGVVEKHGFLARYGGDEFVIISNNATDESIDALVALINTQAEEYNLHRSSETENYSLSFSIGCSHYDPSIDKDSIDSLISRADKEMYAAKLSKQQA